MIRCRNCGEKIIAKPISKEKLWIEEGEKKIFNWNALTKENLIWKNLFMPNWSLLWLVLILYLVWAYQKDIDNCQATLEPIKQDVCGFCDRFYQPCTNAFDGPVFDIVDYNWT